MELPAPGAPGALIMDPAGRSSCVQGMVMLASITAPPRADTALAVTSELRIRVFHSILKRAEPGEASTNPLHYRLVEWPPFPAITGSVIHGVVLSCPCVQLSCRQLHGVQQNLGIPFKSLGEYVGAFLK